MLGLLIFNRRSRAHGRLVLGHHSGLNARGIPTARGEGQWSAVQVARVMERRQ